MTTIAEVRAELAEIAGTISGWRASEYVGDSITGQMIKVFRPAFDPRMVFGNAKTMCTFRCVAYAPRVDADRGEKAIDALAEQTGSGSFIAKVQDGANWSISVDYAVVTQVGETGITQFGTDTAEYLACPFDVEVVW